MGLGSRVADSTCPLSPDQQATQPISIQGPGRQWPRLPRQGVLQRGCVGLGSCGHLLWGQLGGPDAAHLQLSGGRWGWLVCV